jgi:hypothetical protein
VAILHSLADADPDLLERRSDANLAQAIDISLRVYAALARKAAELFLWN